MDEVHLMTAPVAMPLSSLLGCCVVFPYLLLGDGRVVVVAFVEIMDMVSFFFVAQPF